MAESGKGVIQVVHHVNNISSSRLGPNWSLG